MYDCVYCAQCVKGYMLIHMHEICENSVKLFTIQGKNTDSLENGPILKLLNVEERISETIPGTRFQ